MEEKNVKTLIETFCEKISELQTTVSLMKYENERLRKENEELKWHLNPIPKKEIKEDD